MGGDGFGFGAGLCGITEELSFRLLVFVGSNKKEISRATVYPF